MNASARPSLVGDARATPGDGKPLAAEVEQAVASNALLAPWLRGGGPGTLWIGFSGGLDSTVLAHALRGVRGAKAVHVNHGLSPSADDWSRHCVATAATFGLALARPAVRVPAQGNREAAARRARYRCWRTLLGEGDVLALAHHADDQAETRLWQLLTGRTPGGMPTARPLGAGHLVRPLLGVPRNAIAGYAARHGLRWVEDETNADLRFDRNHIRRRLLPPIKEHFPAVLDRLRTPRPAPPAEIEPISAVATSTQAAAAWLLAAGLPCPKRAVAEIVRQSDAGADRQPRVDIAPGVQAWRYAGAWHLVRTTSATVTEHPVTVGVDCRQPAGALTWRRGPVGLPPGMELTLRPRVGGERIRPAGRGVGKAVKTLLRERRIAPWLRRGWPLLYDVEQLVAVPSVAVDQRLAVPDGLFPEWRDQP